MKSFKTAQIKYIYQSLICLSLLLLFGSVEAQSLEDYKLGADDVVSVSVYDEPELSLKETRLSSTGTISLPLIGQISIKGLTVTEAEKKIHDLFLGDYLKNPDITLSIVEYRQFYVNGEVNKPGGYSYRDGMTIQRAITLAGGFTERAARSQFRLLRENGPEKPISADLSTSVQPGDVITVEESFF